MMKTIGYFEKKKGMIVLGANPDEEISEQDFDGLDRSKKVGVNHADRIEFLKANGYEITRENMVDPELSHRNKEDAE